MRARGLTVLEVLVATSVLSVLLLGATELLLTGQHVYAQGSAGAFARTEAQKTLDACVKELRTAAAWTFATYDGTSAVPLTSWDWNTKTLTFSFGPRSNALFYRVVDAQIVPATTPPYVVLDFEPRGLGSGLVQDVGSNGTTLAGRMDDDQLKARVLLRTRQLNGRVVFERVLAPAFDAPTDGSVVIPEFVAPIADLGPAALPGAASPGAVSFETAAPGIVLVKVSAKSVVDQKGKPAIVAAELETQVALTVLAPPR